MRTLTFFAAALISTAAFAQTPPWHNLGRDATKAEVQAWDIDVRPDFKGLPKGAGSVALGERVWEAQCASCHGSFGESNEVFTPIVGGTTKADIERGRVKNLEPGSTFPQKTTMMVGLHQPRHALERAQVAQARRGVRRAGLHPEPVRGGAGRLHAE